jgi:hypothetical protein
MHFLVAVVTDTPGPRAIFYTRVYHSSAAINAAMAVLWLKAKFLGSKLGFVIQHVWTQTSAKLFEALKLRGYAPFNGQLPHGNNKKR